MTQPSFVPIADADQVRPALRLQVPAAWQADRPGDLKATSQPTGRTLGNQGPDQGFALRLAHRFEDRLKLHERETAEDVIVGCALIASRRASLFGRAPSVHDVTVAMRLWGYLDDNAPAELVAERTRAFSSVSHEYDLQRALVDRIPESTLRRPPDEIDDANWRTLLDPAS